MSEEIIELTSESLLENFESMEIPMEACRKGYLRRFRYHLFADAVYWSDEFPPGLKFISENCLRLVLRYRTDILLGRAPDATIKVYWDAAKHAFPNWIGFTTNRCT
jgi:hypothetical protein